MLRFLTFVSALALSVGVAAQPPGNTAPQPSPMADTIPAARDIAYPGTIKLAVDATDTRRGIFRVKETIPVTAGPVTLLYPKWLPGNHSPSGPIDKLAGLILTAKGKTLAWRRDPVDVFAFHVDVPQGVTSIEANFQFLSPTAAAQGRTMMTDTLLSLQWNTVLLYPAGYFTRRIKVDATATYPDGWTSATALRRTGAAASTVRYPTVELDTLIDSPVLAGRYARIEELSPDVTLNIFADRPTQLAATTEQMGFHRNLVDQAMKLYGAQHYDHYNFLFSLSDHLGSIGLEHHRSSENGVPATYFTKWKDSVGNHDLLPHEYTHSWNGKFRRGADLWTPDYRTPMGDSLLWVYEGQTQFWGNVLAARSGLVGHDDAMAALAEVAAAYSSLPGRSWRPLIDTTNDPTISQRRPQAWRSWQRSEDYYSEGQLIWLETDGIIREQSGGKRSLDDFAKAFFGVRDRDWGELTYKFDDVVATLNGVAPYGWATFLHSRVDAVAPVAPLAGLERGGYKLVYTDTPTAHWMALETARKRLDLSYSLGMIIGKDAVVGGVMWDSPAFNAGLSIGTTILAVDGDAFSNDRLKEAVTEAKGGKQPIRLLVKDDDVFREVTLNWNGGLRYPRLERTGTGPASLDALYATRK